MEEIDRRIYDREVLDGVVNAPAFHDPLWMREYMPPEEGLPIKVEFEEEKHPWIEGYENLDRFQRRKLILMVEDLMKKAKPGNWAWRKLEAMGFDGDYIGGLDDGEPPHNYSEDNQ